MIQLSHMIYATKSILQFAARHRDGLYDHIFVTYLVEQPDLCNLS